MILKISVTSQSKMMKTEFVNAYKCKKGLNTVEIGFTKPETPTFLNDALSAYNRKLLFYMAKQFCKKREFKYCWIQDSQITNGNTTNDNQETAETLAKRFHHRMTNKSHISETNSLDDNKTLITDQRDVNAMNLPFTLSELSDHK